MSLRTLVLFGNQNTGFSLELNVLFKMSVSGELGHWSSMGCSGPSAGGVITICGSAEGSTIISTPSFISSPASGVIPGRVSKEDSNTAEMDRPRRLRGLFSGSASVEHARGIDNFCTRYRVNGSSLQLLLFCLL